MILIFLILISLGKTIDFSIAGLSTNMSFVFATEDICTFDTCPKMICDILGNTTSAYIVLSPANKITSCPKTSSSINVNMISFIFNQKGQMTSPFTCTTIGDCMIKICNLFISSKDSFLMSFTGQCF